MSAPAEKPFESRVANLVRMLGSDFDGEVFAAQRALKRLLASRFVTFTDLGDAVERLANGGLGDAEMKRLFDAGYARGVADAALRRAEAQGVFGLKPDGSHDWEAIALHCQRGKARIGPKHHQFVDDMAARMTWRREPTSKQRMYLISLFRELGGRLK
jgi:hypothetical protein